MQPKQLAGRVLAGLKMVAGRARRYTPWWFAIFFVALAMRVGYILIVDPPLGYPTSFQFFWAAMDLASRADLWHEIGTGDYWREWSGWTVAPLYPLFLTILIKVGGARLVLIRLVQAALDATTAVGVAALGRAVGGRRGVTAGLAMAFCAAFVTLSSEVLSECLHTPLLVASLACLAYAVTDDRPRRGAARACLGGVFFGLSALTRAVSSAFLPIAALWTLFECGWRRGAKLGTLFAGTAVLVILPWSARNFLLYGKVVPIETVSVFNLWRDNAGGNPGARQAQADEVVRCKHVGCSAAQAVAYTVENVAAAPGAFVEKVQEQLRHLCRPQALRMWLVAELPASWWSHVTRIACDDGILLTAQALFLAFVLAPPGKPAHRLLVLWTFYYVFLLVVVFHAEIRYRSALTPFLIATAWGGWAALGRRPFRTLSRRQWAALSVGSLWAAAQLAPYVPVVAHIVASAPPLWRTHAAVVERRFADAEQEIAIAVERDRGAARPWRWYGRWLVNAGQPRLAAHAYERGAQQPAGGWLALLVPSLLRDAGQRRVQAPTLGEGLSLDLGGWYDLEAAWEEVPPLHADCVTIGRADFGLVRGFYGPDLGGRWTRRRAWVRILPKHAAREQRITLWMDSGAPSPLAQPDVTVRIGRDEPRVFRLKRESAPYESRARVARGAPVLIEIEAPAWTTTDAAPEQGVRIHRVCVEPAQARAE